MKVNFIGALSLIVSERKRMSMFVDTNAVFHTLLLRRHGGQIRFSEELALNNTSRKSY